MTFMTNYRGFCFIAALTNLATDLYILWKANPEEKEEVSPTLLVSPGCIGTTLLEAVKCKKSQILGRFRACNYSYKVSEKNVLSSKTVI